MGTLSAPKVCSVDGILNFGGLSRDMLQDKPARFSVLPVPYDLTASYISGMRNGPRAIIEASTHMELYDEELDTEPYEAGIETLAQIESTALGPREMIKRVKRASSGIIETGKIPVILGGEHSITLGLVQALLERYPDLSVLQLDAHADMRDEYQDTPFNHACVARRISELCPIIQVGIRSLSVEEADFLKGEVKAGKKAGTTIKTYYATEVIRGINWDAVVRNLTDNICITVDLDVFDPSIMPATGTPEPGGLGWYDALGLLRKAASKKNVVGFDVVELCPLPGNIAPDFLAAKLVYKMMGYVNEGTGKR
ncbi:MAG: agmatinase [Deltaproteobacteria bacterium]|nr:agmatinase [Deltaproteobacteria bacterium]